MKEKKKREEQQRKKIECQQNLVFQIRKKNQRRESRKIANSITAQRARREFQL
jgi:hypothetical protein